MNMVSGILRRLVQASQFLFYQGSPPIPPNHQAVESTVILGGGITGLSTAYFLALANSNARKHNIVVVDPSSTICAGASSQCEGALGRFGFKDEVRPLANLSYELHAQLAQNDDGKQKYGYAKLRVDTTFSEGYDPENPRLPFPVIARENLSALPSWLRVPDSWQAGLISNGSESAKVDSPKFCQYLYEESQHLGVRFIFNSSAVRVHAKADTGLSHVDIRSAGVEEPVQLPCHNLVISAGSWSSEVYSALFPNATCSIPITVKQPAQTWVRLRITDREPSSDRESCAQVWLSPAIAAELHISESLDGELYVAGAIEDAVFNHLPEDFHANPKHVKRLINLTSKYLRLDSKASLKLTGSGRAYMPRTASGLPIISKVPWNYVFSSEDTLTEHLGGGIFLNLGQNLDGFTLGPGSGKVMSELIRGDKPSVDLSPFKFPA